MRACEAVAVTTTDTLQNQEIAGYLGIAASQHLAIIPLWKNFVQSIRNKGNHDVGIEEHINRGVEAAIEDVKNQTRQAGGDALLGLRVNIERAGEDGLFLGISATGTAAVTKSMAGKTKETLLPCLSLPLSREGILMVSTSTLDGYIVDEYLDVVMAYVVLLPAMVDDVVMIWKELSGGRNKRYEKSFEQGLSDAVSVMAKKARDLGANAVIGIQAAFEHTGGNGYVLMTGLTGTAVKLRKLHETKPTNLAVGVTGV